MNMLFRSYQNILMKFPIGAQAVQTGLLMGSGDLIAQSFMEQKSLKNINLVRTGQFTFIGAIFVGPSLRIWYGILEKYIGSKGKMTALKKVTADQLLFAPSFLAAFLGVVGVAQGKSMNELIERIKQDYPDILINNYKLWPAVQLCNFYIVPLQYQVITVQLIAIIWNTYLSWKINRGIPHREHDYWAGFAFLSDLLFSYLTGLMASPSEFFRRTPSYCFLFLRIASAFDYFKGRIAY